jgi:hypothetical protein
LIRPLGGNVPTRESLAPAARYLPFDGVVAEGTTHRALDFADLASQLQATHHESLELAVDVRELRAAVRELLAGPHRAVDARGRYI